MPSMASAKRRSARAHPSRFSSRQKTDLEEPLVWQEACRINNWKDIESPGYGRGYAAALDSWRILLDGLMALRDEKDMAVIILAHSEIRHFDSPEVEGFDRYQPKLHKG